MTMDSVTFPQNYFELFNLSPDYDLDAQDLTVRFRKLQNAVHPDKYAASSDLERRLAMQQSGYINQAYQTLKNPLLRAKHLLKLKNRDMDNDKKSSMDPAFLEQQMKLRESLEQAQLSDSAEEQILALSSEIKQALSEMEQKISDLFAQGDQALLDQIQDFVRRMQFMSKLLEEVNSIEDQYL